MKCPGLHSEERIAVTPRTIADVLESLNVPLAAVADLATGDIQLIGKPESVDNIDLISALFANPQAVQSLNLSLDGQALPRIWSQGDNSCVICKPADTCIVGLFVKVFQDAAESYYWSRKANEAIQRLYNDNR